MNTFNVLTIFPEIFVPLESGIIGKAAENGIIKINKINIRDFSKNKHKNTDDYPYGGGEGMLMTVQPVVDAWRSVENPGKTIFMSPKGSLLDQAKCIELSKEKHLTILCGRYEGIDERILETIIDEEISIGDYVISGGEIAAMILIDAAARMLSGVLGNANGHCNESHFDGLLEYPQYTRPEEYEGNFVPEILLSGNHALIEKFRLMMSLSETFIKRPDMLLKRGLTTEEADILKEEYPDKISEINKLVK